jgi:hypothetical protein
MDGDLGRLEGSESWGVSACVGSSGDRARFPLDREAERDDYEGLGKHAGKYKHGGSHISGGGGGGDSRGTCGTTHSRRRCICRRGTTRR